MQKYNEIRFNRAVEQLREKCIKSPRSLRARFLNSILNKIGKSSSVETVSKNKKSYSDKIKSERKRAIAPSETEWLNLEKKDTNTNKLIACVDIICPVYRGYNETLRCIYSVLKARTNYNFELIIINDKSPEEILTEKLRNLSKRVKFTYIENKENQGFLKSTNMGMLLHEDRDVIWLNSDTEVFDYWLDRILEIASSDNKIGTITPISNNATIASYPKFVFDNSGELEISDSLINNICISDNKMSRISAPTGIGFCMYIRREALKKVGILDEIFNMGYGEENDLCQRLQKSGYKNVLTASTFVRHYGSVSFKEASLGYCKENTVILNRKHPNYAYDVQEWVKLDPIKPLRVRIDAARIYYAWTKKHEETPKEVVLHLSHNRGGGTQKFINELTNGLELNHIASFNLYPLSNRVCTLRTFLLNTPNIERLNYSAGIDEIKALVEGLKVTKIHIHSLVDWNLIIANVLADISKELEIPIYVSVHDYHWCCSKINLMPNEKDCCLNVGNASCFACDKNTDISTYEIRSKAKLLYSIAKKVIFPDEDVLKRYLKVFNIPNYCVIPHATNGQPFYIQKKEIESVFKICAIGNINSAKGSGVMCDLASYIKENNIKASVMLLGRIDKKNKLDSVESYQNFDELVEKIKKISPSIIFIPSICPETYCYTLTEALASNIPIASFNIGAPANRMKQLGLGDNLIDLTLKDNPEKVYLSLLDIARRKSINQQKSDKKNEHFLRYYF